MLVLILLIGIFIGFAGYSWAEDRNGPALTVPSKEELFKMLEQMPVSEDPSTLYEEPVGAMCYDTAAPLDRVQYICPECGEMTLYDSMFGSKIENLQTYRALVKKIKKIKVKLDESQFCDKCNPDVSYPQFCLIVKLDKNKEAQKTCGITETDINLIYEYSEGKIPLSDVMYLFEER